MQLYKESNRTKTERVIKCKSVLGSNTIPYKSAQAMLT